MFCKGGCAMKKKMLVNEEERVLQEFKNFKFLNGCMEKKERCQYLKEKGFKLKAEAAYMAIMKISMSALTEHNIREVIHFILKKNAKGEGNLRIYYLKGNDLLLLLCLPKQLPSPKAWFSNLQNDLNLEFGLCSFITVSNCFTDLTEMPKVYRTIQKMQKYLIIDGYGSCMDEMDLRERAYTEVTIDREKLVYCILKKDSATADQYIEELFTSNIQKKTSIDVLDELVIRITLILQEIRMEYNLTKEGRSLSDMIEDVWKAEDIASIKKIFLSEITELVSWGDMEKIQYNPVVHQIAAEVKNHYQNDMNLKTLASKYHMNTSYLGQVFQKEMGCPFSQYLNNVRNEVAKNLLLTTNMRISDIACSVGYSNTSYFYKKFKQSYGVSPMALRNMKNYNG